ncbi:MAG: nicotinate-nucleotide--dimethylbenzimidazole phosphoribosyltransferase, partial [Myxococcota bacterium]
NFAVGGAAASVAASHLDIPLQVVDVGVAHPYGDTEGSGAVVVRHPVADATEGDVRTEDAMSWETLADAIDAGRTAVDRLSADTRVLVLGEMGIGNTTLASAMACALLDAAPELVVGRGTGVDDAQLAVKCAVVHDAVERVHDRSPLGVLRCLGGRELAAIYGAAARACERRMAVLVDGFIVSTALLALVREHPEAGPHLVFGHRSREPGHAAVLEALGARPLVDLSMALGEGSGALAAFPLLDLACRLHRDMATFEEAGVPERDS